MPTSGSEGCEAKGCFILFHKKITSSVSNWRLRRMGKEEYNAIAVHTFLHLESQTNDYCESAYNIIMAMKSVLNPKVVAAAGAFSLLGRTDGFALGKPIVSRKRDWGGDKAGGREREQKTKVVDA
eukprot:Gb_37223 [translate_table: standard]